MALNQYEKTKIINAIREKLSILNFAFDGLEITEKAEGSVQLLFSGCSHSTYKNVRIMSHLSECKETPLYTQVYINLRFLHGKFTSPKVGLKITSFNMNIS